MSAPITLPLSTLYFQPALSAANTGHVTGWRDDRLGAVVADAADIDQCIHVICLTPLGSDPLRPTFGCGLLNHIDTPINTARPAIVRDITAALGQWEPRIVVESVTVDVVSQSTLEITIFYKLANDLYGAVFASSFSTLTVAV